MPPAAVGSVGSDAACGAGRVSRNKTLLFLPPARIGFGFPAGASRENSDYHELENLIFNQPFAPRWDR
jgi:hypothetical protein